MDDERLRVFPRETQENGGWKKTVRAAWPRIRTIGTVEMDG